MTTMDPKHYHMPCRELWSGREDSQQAERIHQRIHLASLQDLPALANKVNFGILGFQCDVGVKRNLGRIGAEQGPNAIRKALGPLCIQRSDCGLYDFGNIHCPDEDLEAAQQSLGRSINQLLCQRITPIVLGGGHETAWGHFQGIFPHVSGEKIGIINLDAHFDLRLPIKGHGTSGTPFWQIAKHCEDSKQLYHYLCLGIQSSANTSSLYQQADCVNCTYLEAENINRSGLRQSEELIATVSSECQHLYLSICLDVFAAHIAPGVSSPQTFGLDTWQVVSLIKKIISTGKVLAIDIVELSPPWDEQQRTAKLAANLVSYIISQISPE